MTKGQHGNKEAKKPKKSAPAVVLPNTGTAPVMPESRATATPPARRR